MEDIGEVDAGEGNASAVHMVNKENIQKEEGGRAVGKDALHQLKNLEPMLNKQQQKNNKTPSCRRNPVKKPYKILLVSSGPSIEGTRLHLLCLYLEFPPTFVSNS